MAAPSKNAGLGVLRWCRETAGTALARFGSRKLRSQFEGEFTDNFLELLLGAMQMAFRWLPGYGENIVGYEGKLAFESADGGVAASALFQDGRMEMRRDAVADYSAKVSFKSQEALWAFLTSDGQDILGCILNNEVELDGNYTHVYRFGFLALDLKRRLGIP